MKFLAGCKDTSTRQVIFNSNSPANMAVVIKINPERRWQENVASVLAKLEGVHRFELDAEQATVKIQGNLQPDLLMRMINKSTRNAQISKVYMMKDGITEDIFAPPEEEPPADDQGCCNNQCNHLCNGQYYQLGYYDHNNCNNGRASPPPQPQPTSCGNVCYPSPSRLCHPPGWQYQHQYQYRQPIYRHSYYENEPSSACSIM